MTFTKEELSTPKPFSDSTIASIVLAAMAKARLGWTSDPDPEQAKNLITASEKMTRVFAGCCEAIRKEFHKPTVDTPYIARLLLAACAYAFNHPITDPTPESLVVHVQAYASSELNRKSVTALAVLLATWHERGTMTISELEALSVKIRSTLECL